MEKSYFKNRLMFILFISIFFFGSPAVVPAADTASIASGPSIENFQQPRYPSTALMLEREGTVLIKIIIDESGRLVDAKIIKSAGYEFDKGALWAVKHSTFRPATRNWEPVHSVVYLPIRFMFPEK